jgi:hypothetical protein
LGEIIGVLTLPNLREILFRSSIPDDDPLFWPREQFPAFTSRSSLGESLTTLSLYHMVITKDELAECLSETKVLQELFIQDVSGDADFEREEHILITDSLFQRLASRSEPSASASCLVPELHTFSFASLFFFDDPAFLGFLEPRVTPVRNRAFTVETLSLIDSKPDLGIVGHGLGNGAVVRMEGLKAQGRLRWARYGSKYFKEEFPGVCCAFSSSFMFPVFCDSLVISRGLSLWGQSFLWPTADGPNLFPMFWELSHSESQGRSLFYLAMVPVYYL